MHSSSVFIVSVASLFELGGADAGHPWIARFFNSPEAGQVLPVAALTFVIPVAPFTRR